MIQRVVVHFRILWGTHHREVKVLNEFHLRMIKELSIWKGIIGGVRNVSWYVQALQVKGESAFLYVCFYFNILLFELRRFVNPSFPWAAHDI
jgi:hypothetical protein